MSAEKSGVNQIFLTAEVCSGKKNNFNEKIRISAKK
jgi:hypothetical protein